MLSNVILHVGVYTARTTVVTKLFLRELQEKYDIDDAEFFVDGAPWLQAGLFELGIHFRHEIHGDRNPVKRVFQEIKRRTNQFYNNFFNADPETVDSWLKAIDFAQNHFFEQCRRNVPQCLSPLSPVPGRSTWTVASGAETALNSFSQAYFAELVSNSHLYIFDRYYDVTSVPVCDGGIFQRKGIIQSFSDNEFEGVNSATSELPRPTALVATRSLAS